MRYTLQVEAESFYEMLVCI